MSDYFKTIPLVQYTDLQANNNTVVLTNIMTRSAFLREVLENTALFYDYQVKDGETPEIIAHKLYGTTDRHWLVLLFNNLSNPFYDFPLTTDQLNDFVVNKYGTTLAAAQSTIHHHYALVTRSVLYNGILQSEESERFTISELYSDPTTGLAVTRPTITLTPDTCVSVSSVSEAFANGITIVTDTKHCNVTNYTHEFEENEKRRSIRLLDKSYAIAVENEFRRLMRDGN